MGCHIYLYDAKQRKILSPSVSVSGMKYEGMKFTTRLEAHRFIAQIRQELGCREMTLEEKLHVLEQGWRNEKIEPRDRAAIDLDWIVEIINSPEFGYLDCG